MLLVSDPFFVFLKGRLNWLQINTISCKERHAVCYSVLHHGVKYVRPCS
jgi:hypothetical protein